MVAYKVKFVNLIEARLFQNFSRTTTNDFEMLMSIILSQYISVQDIQLREAISVKPQLEVTLQ